MSIGSIAKTKVTLNSGLNSVEAGDRLFTIYVTQVTQGLTGRDGDTAPGSGDSHYLHPQNSASALWIITHNLGKYPSVTVVDSAGDECEGEVRHVSPNQLRISFTAPFTGRAFLN